MGGGGGRCRTNTGASIHANDARTAPCRGYRTAPNHVFVHAMFARSYPIAVLTHASSVLLTLSSATSAAASSTSRSGSRCGEKLRTWGRRPDGVFEQPQRRRRCNAAYRIPRPMSSGTAPTSPCRQWSLRPPPPSLGFVFSDPVPFPFLRSLNRPSLFPHPPRGAAAQHRPRTVPTLDRPRTALLRPSPSPGPRPSRVQFGPRLVRYRTSSPAPTANPLPTTFSPQSTLETWRTSALQAYLSCVVLLQHHAHHGLLVMPRARPCIPSNRAPSPTSVRTVCDSQARPRDPAFQAFRAGVSSA